MNRNSIACLAVLVLLLFVFPGARALALTATFNTAADIPVTSSGYTASGSLTLALNFAPQPGTALTVVKNTALTPISGAFTGLPQGGTISAVFAGHTYNFIAHYWGGTGNDLVLVWPDMGLAAWGGNMNGALGDGSTTNRLSPVAVDASGVLAGKTILAISSGYEHSLALTSEGKVYAWGGNGFAQLGDGTTIQRVTPVQVVHTGVLSGKMVVAIAAGGYHSLALTSEGKLYAWGNDFYQQLGDGSGTNGSSTTPIAVNMAVSLAGKTVVAIAAGGYHNLALSSDGILHAWGDSLYGQTGSGLFNVSVISPVSVTSVDPAVTGKLALGIAAGLYHSLALLADGTVAAWGLNGNGQLGDGTTTNRSQAVAIVQTGALAGKTVTALSAGGWHSMALSADGKTFGWGHNGYGQLATSSLSDAVSQPVGIIQGLTVTSISAGYLHSLALTSDQVLYAWGQGTSGELGNGGSEYALQAVRVTLTGALAYRRLLHLPTMSTARHSMIAASHAPMIRLEDNGFVPAVILSSGGSVAFATLQPGQNESRTFTVRNLGTLPLTGLSMSVDGPQTTEYTITQQPAATVAPGSSTSFVVRFAPAATGLRLAAFHLTSNAPDQPRVDISLNNTGVSPGTLDAFDANVSGGSLQVLAVALQPDGKILIGGTFTMVGGVERKYIARVLPDGSLDAGFNPKADSIVYCMAVQADGKILVGGYFTSFQPNGAASATPRNRIARLNADGTLDSTFNPNANATVFCVAQQADGKVLLGGGFTTLQPNGAASATPRNRIARLNADGTLDPVFNPNANTDSVICMQMQTDGKVVLGGGFTSLQPNGAATATTRNRIARVNADGTLDSGFDPNANGGVSSMGTQADGKILLGGYFTTFQPNGAALATTRNRLARVNPDGTLDTAFDPNVGPDAYSGVYSMAVQTNGKVVITGGFSSIQPNGAAQATARQYVARVHGDGTVDTGFDPNPNFFSHGCAIQADGKVLLCGQFGTLQPNGAASPIVRFSLARLLNEAGTQSLTAPQATTMLWTRGGGSPEVSIASFEQSLDAGGTWTPLGAATRVGTSSNWELTGLSLPIGVPLSLRARGVVSSGYLSGCAGLVEAVITTQFADPPDIAVEQPAGTNLIDGGSAAFGNVDATAGTTRTFTIRNTGVGSLTVGAITFDGANSGDFTITQAPAGTVTPGGSTTFNLRCLPLGLGTRAAALHIASNDPDEAPFDLDLACTGTGILTLPEIVVEDTTSGTVNLTDGGSVGFGSLETTQNVTRNFTVRNTGTVALTGLAIIIDGTHSTDFTVTLAPASSVAAGGSTTFTIRCQPGALGARSAALHLANNDPDEAPFDLAFTCTGIAPPPAPEIVVEDSTSGTVDLTDGGSVGFGTVALVQQATRTFTVRNIGTANLTGLAITIDGTNSGDFTVTQAPAATVAVGGSTTFAVRCQPLAAVARTAALHLANNDANESPFDLTLTCTGVDAEVVSVTFNSAADIPVTAAGYTATNKVLSITLNFIPTFSTNLTVIRNTGQAFITGTFNGLPHGAEISLIYLNKSYPFIADYYGGTGNDLVLVPKNTTIAAAGWNLTFQLGDGTQTTRITSVTVNGVAGLSGRSVLAVASGQGHSLALTRDGLVYAWGKNDVGQIGDGTMDAEISSPPVLVGTSGALGGKTVIAIAAGEKHSVALTSEGKVYEWGWNSVGQLGDGTNTDRPSPVQTVTTGVLTGKTIIAIAAGGNHTIALTADNLLFAWGWNSYGQIGDNSSFNRTAPVAVNTAIGIPAGKTFVSVAAGSVHSMVLSSDGRIYMWGRNNNGQLGDASTTNRLAPVPVVTSGVLNTKTIVAIAGGGYHSNALSSDGLLYAWGLNSSGQLGDNTLTQSTSPVTTLITPLTGRTVTHLAASFESTHVRLADGAVYSCGQNIFGQLAVGDTTNRSLLAAAVTASGGLLNRPALELGPAPAAYHLLALTAIDPPGGFGTLLTPEIVIEDITDGGTVDLTDNSGSVGFGNGATARSVTRTFRVRNTGTGDLTGLALSMNGAHASDFTPSSFSGTTVPAGGSLSFSVAFSPLGDGTRTAALHIANNDANEAPFDIVLTGTGKTGAYWTWAFDLGIIDDPLAAPGADMEGDGTDNRLEFAFGLSPLQKDTRGMTFNGSTFTTGLPFALLTGSPPRIRVTFLRRLNAPGLSYTVEFSDDNVTWQAASSAPVVASTNGNFEAVTVDDTVPPPSRTRRLVRVRVTAP